VAYDAHARGFLLRAKLGCRPELLELLGRQLTRLVEIEGFAADGSVIVPVPSHPWVSLQRGFSPARELARPMAHRLGLPLRRWLRRRIGAPRLSKRLRARQRREAAARAFVVRGEVSRRSILLVDDVMTTGATVEGCARALKLAGARSVRVAVWARTLPDPRGCKRPKNARKPRPAHGRALL
jgi:predicted amidophosphoribosyltransferase